MTKTKVMARMLIKIKPYFLLPDGRLYSPLPFYNFPSPQISARCHPEKTFGSHPDTAPQTTPAHQSDSAAKINRRVRSCFLRISCFRVSSSFSQLTRTFLCLQYKNQSSIFLLFSFLSIPSGIISSLLTES